MSYDPRVHSNVIRNLRPQLPSELNSYVSDEEIWDAWQKSAMYDYADDADHVKICIELLEEMLAER